jgi:hypothetical protein
MIYYNLVCLVGSFGHQDRGRTFDYLTSTLPGAFRALYPGLYVSCFKTVLGLKWILSNFHRIGGQMWQNLSRKGAKPSAVSSAIRQSDWRATAALIERAHS